MTMRFYAREKQGTAALAGTVAVLLLSLCCALPVTAASTSERNAEELAEMRRELPEMIRKAEAGSPDDQLVLGFVYAAGVEGKPNNTKALYWYEQAASQGDYMGCFMAYVLYVEGMGTKRDLAKAEKWARKLIASDKSEGYFLLGTLYDEGAGSRTNYAKAAEYYSKSEMGGADIGGDYRLGMFYLEGKGVRADKEKALEHLEEAADNRDNHAAFQLGMMYYEGKRVPQDDEKALRYFEQAAYKRTPGMFNLGPDLFGEAYLPGYEYTRGMGKLMGKNPNVRAEANYMMGLMVERGRAGVKNPDFAMHCYKEAAEEGHELARQRYELLKADGENGRGG